jgi:hypothetical protein
MSAGDSTRGVAPSPAAGSAANYVNDPNAALWASLRPPAPPPWPVRLRRSVAAFSVKAFSPRSGQHLLSWLGSRDALYPWLLSAALSLCIGLGVGFTARLWGSSANDGDVQREHPLQIEKTAAPQVAAAAPRTAASPILVGISPAPAFPLPQTSYAPNSPRLAKAPPAAKARRAAAVKKRSKHSSRKLAAKSRHRSPGE